MRVALDVTPLAGDRTGIGNFVSELVHGLADMAGIDLVGLALTARGRDEISAALPAGVPLSRPAPARLLREVWQRLNIPPIELLAGRVDLVHGTNFVSPPAAKAASLVTIHDLGPWHSKGTVDRSSLVYPNLVRRALERGSHIHTVSNFVATEIMSELGIEQDLIHVIANGIRHRPGGTAASGQAAVGGRPYALALGTVEPRKDFPLLVKAFTEIAALQPDLRLVIAGREAWGSQALDDAVTGSPFATRIIRLGFVDDQTRADLLAGAELLVSAARYEGFGLVPLEAMAAGLPVVAVAGGAIPEVCGQAAELVNVGDVDALAAAVCRVVESERHRQALIDAGRVQAAAFSWDQTAAQMADLYRRLI